MEIRKWFAEINRRVSALEKGSIQEHRDVIEMDLILPKENIDGLRFNEQKVHAVFDKHDDGWYYSRDILFLSARNYKSDNSRDILMEYLNNHESYGSIKAQIAAMMSIECIMDIEISLPEENEGIKEYNGVKWWYWRRAAVSSGFRGVSFNGGNYNTYAHSVGGVAPTFCIRS